MSPDCYLSRQEDLLRLIREAEVDALLVTSVVNVSYLTGFSGDSSFLLIGPSVRVLISDSRYQTQIVEECPGLEADIRTQKTKQEDQVKEVIGRARLRKLAIESHVMSHEDFTKLTEQIRPLEVKPLAGKVEELRKVKDAEEIADIRLAVQQAEQGFGFLRSMLSNMGLESTTERQAAQMLEQAMRTFGADRAAFKPIVAVGDRSALPHYRAGDSRLDAAPFVLVDWGAVTPSGYHSDLTRVLVTDNVPAKLQELHGLVLKAQLAGIAAIRPGAKLAEVDAVARRVIEEAGYGSFFGHGLGHGIGLHIHEEPRLNSIAEGELQPGNVVTIEPGIYLPEFGGVRIEDDVLVTPDGHEVLTSLPKELA